MKQAIWALTQRRTSPWPSSVDAHADCRPRWHPELIYAGNHGLEINGPGIGYIEPTRDVVAELHALAQEMGRRLRNIPGVLVEDKV